jgi:hypothetical protein
MTKLDRRHKDGFIGRHHSERTKRKMSLNQMGKNNSFYGREFTNEHRHKISLGNKGKIRSPETRIKISQNNAMHIKKYRDKVSKTLKGRMISDEHRKNIVLNHPNFKGKNNPLYGKRWKMSNGHKEHHDAVLEEMARYKKQGFKVMRTEKICPDFIARLGNKDKFYAVEVELTRPLASDYCVHKYDGVDIFNDIHWIKRDRNMKF